MDRTSKTHVYPLLIACFLGFSLGAKGQVELISSDTLRIDSLRVEEIKIGYAVGNQQTLSGAVDKVSEKRMSVFLQVKTGQPCCRRCVSEVQLL